VSGEVELFRAVPDDADALTRIAFAAKSYSERDPADGG
jgi:hypothetical protein